MKRTIEKILESHKNGEIITWKAVNDILLLTIVSRDDVIICPICEEIIIVGGLCPRCTVELCSPGPIIL